MGTNEILNQAINLKPQEKYVIIEALVQSLNEPDKEIEKQWIDESERRLKLYEKGELETVSYDEVFNK